MDMLLNNAMMTAGQTILSVALWSGLCAVALLTLCWGAAGFARLSR
jgi:hypothetical protein